MEINRLSTSVTGHRAWAADKRKVKYMAVIKVTKENFEAEVLNSDKKVLVDFWADWCGPCRMVGPILDEIAAERPDIKVCKVNVDEHPELAAQYMVRSIPMMIVVKDGERAAVTLGAQPKAALLKFVDEA